jgi:hypothetical protein
MVFSIIKQKDYEFLGRRRRVALEQTYEDPLGDDFQNNLIDDEDDSDKEQEGNFGKGGRGPRGGGDADFDFDDDSDDGDPLGGGNLSLIFLGNPD